MRTARWALAALCVTTSPACAAPEASTPDRYPVGDRPMSIATADFDRDGHLDVVVVNSGDGTLTILRGIGEGRLRALPSTTPGGTNPSNVDAVDLDKDGDPDLVIANHETSNVTVLLNDGKAKFTPGM